MAEQSYVERPPIAPLAGLVSSVWIQRVAPGAEPYTHRNIPNGGVELVCALGGAPRIVGPLTAPLVEVLPPGTIVVGMRFRPGTAPVALGLPADELVDLALDADALWGVAAAELGERLDGAASAEAALALLQAHVADGATGTPDPLVAAAVRRLRWSRDDVTALTTALYISERQLRRRCLAAVGVAPKALQRMLRFQQFLALAQHAMAQGRAPTGDGLALLAAEAGYADQPHLTRECARLTGVAPGAFLGEAAHTCACGHDHSASYAPLLRARPGVHAG